MQEEKELTIDDIRKKVAEHDEMKHRGKLVQLIVFRLGEEEYALHIDQIKEVVLTPGIARIPQTPKYIRGVSNIRGNIIAIVDLEDKFKLSSDVDQVKRPAQYTLVVESDTFKVGVLVKDVPNTLTVSENEIDKDSTVLQYSNLDEECIKGIVKSGKRMIIMIDMIKMMEMEELRDLKNIK